MSEYVVLRLSPGKGFSDVTDNYPDVGTSTRYKDNIGTKAQTWSNWRRWTGGRYSGQGVQPKDIFGEAWGPEYDYSQGPIVYIVDSSSPKRRNFSRIKGTGPR